MKTISYKAFFAFVLSLSLMAGAPAMACSWAAFANGKAAVVARSMDWYCDDPAIIKGHGRGEKVKGADTPGAVEYAAKYASIQIHSFGKDIVTDAMNEKGLQCSTLYLADSQLPAPQAGRKDLDPNIIVSYIVANFATVNEALDTLKTLNFVSKGLTLPGVGDASFVHKGTDWPLHFALADAGGDKAIVEFVKGEMLVYHGKEHDALTNEPAYTVQQALDSMQYRPNGGITPEDRRARAKGYLRDMYERGVATTGRALLAMRGLLASVFAGTEEIDRVENEVYPTIWTTLADQQSGTYYFSRSDSWCSEIYDFSMFAVDKPEVVALTAANCPYKKITAAEEK